MESASLTKDILSVRRLFFSRNMR